MDGSLSMLGLISLFKDLTEVVQRVGEHYIGIGEHSDLWKGKLEVDGVPTLVWLLFFTACVFTHGILQVAIKVLRGGSSSRPDFREHLIKVYFFITPVMQTALAPVLATSQASHPVAEAIPSSRCEVLRICIWLRYTSRARPRVLWRKKCHGIHKAWKFSRNEVTTGPQAFHLW